MRFVNKTVLTAADNIDSFSQQIDANQLVSASFHIFFGDTNAAGTFVMQASNDPYPNGYLSYDFVATNWVNIPTMSVIITNGSPAILTARFSTMQSYRWIRTAFLHNSMSPGTSTLTVNMMALSV